MCLADVVYSPELHGFSIVMGDGKALFISAKSAKYEPQVDQLSLIIARLFYMIDDIHFQHVWQSQIINLNIIPSHISSTSSSLTHYSTKLPIRTGLICDMLTHEYLMRLYHVKLDDELEIRNRKILDFYLGLYVSRVVT